MNEFRFLDYYTEYSCKGLLQRDMRSSVCFEDAFRALKPKSTMKYKIVLYSGIDQAKYNHRSNACLFTKGEVRNHIKLLKSLYPIKYSVRDYNRDDKRFLITLYIDDAPGIFHKYALTWIRYLYEFPYNVLLRDAYILKKDSDFKFESIANIFNAVLAGYCNTLRSVHQIPYNNSVVEKLKIAQLKEKINKSPSALNDIYQVCKEGSMCIPKQIQDFKVTDIEYWDEGYDERKPIYIKIYKNQIK